MRLPDGEPEFGPWVDRSFREVLDLLGVVGRSRAIVAVDGRSAGGKTTFAASLADVTPAATVIHTDDVAWHHSFFDWVDLLVGGVIEPFLDGREVAHRPPAWDERGREGAIRVSAGTELLIVEGVGAARRELSRHLDAVVWVQSDVDLARSRGIERDGGDRAAEEFWDEWMATEVPFLADDRPWDRADLVVNGTPERPAVGTWIATSSPAVDRPW